MSIPEQPALSVSFNEAWWQRYDGLAITERWYTDIACRAAHTRARAQALHRRFGHLGLGQADPPPTPGLLWPQNPVGEAFGLTYRYDEAIGRWPIPLDLDDAACWALRPVHDFGATACAEGLLQEMETLTRNYGWTLPPPGVCQGTSGIMNTLLDIRGYALLEDLHDQPALARHLIRVVAATLQAYLDWQCELWGTRPDTLGLGNCSDTMISPRDYAAFIFPGDEWLAASYQHLGIHRDDKLEPYLDVYLQHPKLNAVDCGWDSSVAAIRTRLPAEAFHLNLRPNPGWLAHATPEQVIAQLRAWVAEAGAPYAQFALICEVDAGTPDANVEALFHALDQS